MPEQQRVSSKDRREVLKKLAWGTGAVTSLPVLPVLAQPAISPCCGASEPKQAGPGSDSEWKPLFLDEHQNETVIVLSDLIIPETDTPGAKAAQVNRLIDLWLNDEESDVQKEFLGGLAWLDGRSLKLHGKPFVQLDQAQQLAILTPLSDPKNANPEDHPGVKFFQQMKDFTLFGYYTSRIGLEEELHYDGGNYHAEFPGACDHPEHQNS